MRTLLIAATLAALSTMAQAQAPAGPPASGVPAPNNPPVDCRAQAQAKGLRGQERRDATALCAAERRVACVKEGIDRKIVGSVRRDFVRACSGRPARERDDNQD